MAKSLDLDIRNALFGDNLQHLVKLLTNKINSLETGELRDQHLKILNIVILKAAFQNDLNTMGQLIKTYELDPYGPYGGNILCAAISGAMQRDDFTPVYQILHQYPELIAHKTSKMSPLASAVIAISRLKVQTGSEAQQELITKLLLKGANPHSPVTSSETCIDFLRNTLRAKEDLAPILQPILDILTNHSNQADILTLAGDGDGDSIMNEIM